MSVQPSIPGSDQPLQYGTPNAGIVLRNLVRMPDIITQSTGQRRSLNQRPRKATGSGLYERPASDHWHVWLLSSGQTTCAMYIRYYLDGSASLTVKLNGGV